MAKIIRAGKIRAIRIFVRCEVIFLRFLLRKVYFTDRPDGRFSDKLFFFRIFLINWARYRTFVRCYGSAALHLWPLSGWKVGADNSQTGFGTQMGTRSMGEFILAKKAPRLTRSIYKSATYFPDRKIKDVTVLAIEEP